jgi:hypothetical protein
MKYFMFSALLIFAVKAQGQLWFDVGLKGGGGSGFLNNKAISSDSRLSINPGYNYFFGGKIGFNYGYYVSIATDITYGKNSFSFNQAELNGSPTTFKYSIDYNCLNIAPLFRFTKEASYVEIGPEFSMIKSPTITDEATSTAPVDATEEINSKLTNLVFGFGGYIVGNEVVALQMGLRLHYTISNLTSDTYEASKFPLNNYTDIDAGIPTSPFILQLHLELNFSLGQIARSTSKCGRRVAFLSF